MSGIPYDNDRTGQVEFRLPTVICLVEIPRKKRRVGESVSDNIEALAVRGYPEGRPAPSPVLVAGIEHSFVTKVIIADQRLFFSA